MSTVARSSASPDTKTTWLCSRSIDFALLALILMSGTILRAFGVFHGSSFHPDERHIVMVTTGLEGNGMNPKSFAYGSFNFYAAWGLSRVMWFVWNLLGGNETFRGSWPNPTEYDGMFVVGRVFCLTMGIIAIPLVYWLCCLLYRRSVVGLVAAALLSFNVFHIQLSRFFTSDVTLTTLSLASITALVLVYRTNSLWAYLTFGTLLGLATATKISSAFLATPLALMLFLALLRDLGWLGLARVALRAVAITLAVAALTLIPWWYVTSGAPSIASSWRIDRYPLDSWAILITMGAPFFLALSLALIGTSPYLSRAALALGIAFIVFICAEPFAILDFKTFAAHTQEQTSMVQGLWRPPYTIQYEHTMPYFFHLKQMLWYTMGWPLFLAVAAGISAAIARAIVFVGSALKDRASGKKLGLEEVIPLVFVIVFFLATAKFQVKFPRYLLPLYPFLFVFAASLFTSVGARIRSHSKAPVIPGIRALPSPS